jgi:hypothetical protein
VPDRTTVTTNRGATVEPWSTTSDAESAAALARSRMPTGYAPVGARVVEERGRLDGWTLTSLEQL